MGESSTAAYTMPTRHASARRPRAVARRAPRTWGFWTQAKLDILRDYLAAFLAASSGKAPAAVYLDAFAGEGTGRDRLTHVEFDGSARIAADAVALGSSGYRFSHLRFFELNATRAETVQADLRERYPGRDIEVVPGDCNVSLPATLAAMPEHLRRAPTFAFLDPFGTELAWPMIGAVAEHKRDRPYKVEFWMLFSAAGLMRIAGSTPEKASVGAEGILTRLYGNHEWEPIVQLRRQGTITGRAAREAFVNLMRWQLEQQLGYASTHALEVKNSGGTSVYHMVFATDHDAGDRIIRSLYAKAASALPEMAQEARELTSGVFSLFPTAGEVAPPYEHEAPIAPDEFLASRLLDTSA